jgi:hypothetical protein
MKTVRMEVMKNPTQIRLYDIFRKDLHMPDDRAQNLVSTINEALNDHSEQDRENLPTKAFVKEEILATRDFVKAEISATRDFVKAEILATRDYVDMEFKSFRAEVKDEFKSVRAEIGSLKDQYRDLKVSITQQIFLVNLIQFLAIVGAVLAIYTFLRK